MTETYVTIAGRAEGSQRDGFRTVYYWDGCLFMAKSAAVSYGFEKYGCDDFNIGTVQGGKLTGLWWMDEQVTEDAETLARIGSEIGLGG